MQITNTYQNYMATLKAEKKVAIKSLLENHCKDDATFKQVELNIIEIFEKMFEISVKKSHEDAIHPRDTLKVTFLAFFDKIPLNWHAQREKSQQFDDSPTKYIETLKIEQANAMKHKFLSLLEEEAHGAH